MNEIEKVIDLIHSSVICVVAPILGAALDHLDLQVIFAKEQVTDRCLLLRENAKTLGKMWICPSTLDDVLEGIGGDPHYQVAHEAIHIAMGHLHDELLCNFAFFDEGSMGIFPCIVLQIDALINEIRHQVLPQATAEEHKAFCKAVSRRTNQSVLQQIDHTICARQAEADFAPSLAIFLALWEEKRHGWEDLRRMCRGCSPKFHRLNREIAAVLDEFAGTAFAPFKSLSVAAIAQSYEASANRLASILCLPVEPKLVLVDGEYVWKNGIQA